MCANALVWVIGQLQIFAWFHTFHAVSFNIDENIIDNYKNMQSFVWENCQSINQSINQSMSNKAENHALTTSVALGSAPIRNSLATTDFCPLLAARCSGVRRFCITQWQPSNVLHYTLRLLCHQTGLPYVTTFWHFNHYSVEFKKYRIESSLLLAAAAAVGCGWRGLVYWLGCPKGTRGISTAFFGCLLSRTRVDWKSKVEILLLLLWLLMIKMILTFTAALQTVRTIAEGHCLSLLSRTRLSRVRWAVIILQTLWWETGDKSKSWNNLHVLVRWRGSMSAGVNVLQFSIDTWLIAGRLM